MSAKVQKLEKQFLRNAEIEVSETETGELAIFQGISVFVNGYTDPSAEEIKRIMMVHGGTYQHYYKRKPKCYMIATNLPMAKLKSLRDYVVRPSWITDCVKAGMLLPVQDYLLYSPDLKKGQQMINRVQLADESGTSTMTSAQAHNDEQDGWLSSDSSVDCNLECEQLHGDQNGTDHGSPPQEHKSNDSPRYQAGDPRFLQEFYGRSRLHHISTASLKLRDYVAQLRSAGNFNFVGVQRLKSHLEEQTLAERVQVPGKVLMHIDMDCFFVSVGLRSRPHLKGKPVAVCHGKNGGIQPSSNHSGALDAPGTSGSGADGKGLMSMSEVASCSYEARDAGVRSGMFLGRAKQLCPNLVAIPYEFESYSEVSKILYDTVASYTLDIEAVSCDELYADVTKVLQEAECTPNDFASFLRKEIEEKTCCTASVGLGPNMLAARVANRSAKPNGHRFVSTSELLEFFKAVAVKHLPGVGYRLQSQLTDMGIETCEQLQAVSMETLKSKFGVKTGTLLYQHARGSDDKVLQFNKVRKSVSAEVNYGIRFKEANDMNKFIGQLSEEVEKRLREAGVQGRAVSLKLKVRQKDAPLNPTKFMGHGMCDNITKSVQLLAATSSAAAISRECCNLAAQLHLVPSDIRGVGIQVGRLEPRQGVQSCGSKTMLDFLTDNRSTLGAAHPSAREGATPGEGGSTATDANGLGAREAVSGVTGMAVASTSGAKPKPPTGKRRGRPPKTASPQKARGPACHSLREYMVKPAAALATAAEPSLSVISSKDKMEKVKMLLQEWICSRDGEISNTDVNAWTQLLGGVVQERNLEKLDLLLKFFYR
ncbi:hypothetical protein HPB47_027212 [Ixodes persulcatus]|uniref:Uncharacterized protein n=1 Tax=Ixodes persulcatus TaxID=34615 RepID=A0AC60PWJ5_IXOPE|nr:hypothetical protein HPB47_027212 [Ixodes persulcatus]